MNIEQNAVPDASTHPPKAKKKKEAGENKET